MILSNILSSATSFSTQGSERLSEIAKFLAPAVQMALGTLRRQDEFCLNCSTVLVAIGVILEAFEIVHELREKLGSFKFHHPEMPKWMLVAGFAGWLMIVAGVTGEFVFESAVNIRSEELESISNALLGDTEISATEASKRASAAEQDDIDMGIGLEQQKARTVEAEKELELEKIERLKLEALVDPRRLTIDEQKAIGSACGFLYTYGPRKRIKVGSYGLDAEGAALAIQINASLNSVPLYTSTDIGDRIVSGGFDTGVIISAPPEDELFANCLKSALTNIGKLTDVQVNPARHVGNASVQGAAE